MFIPDLISRIKFNPSIVKWECSLINLAILHQSIKSNNFTSSRAKKKKGIIILVISENLNIVKITAGFPEYLYIFPEPQYLI